MPRARPESQVIDRAFQLVDQFLDPNRDPRQRAQQQPANANPEQNDASDQQRREEKAAEPQELQGDAHVEPGDNADEARIEPELEQRNDLASDLQLSGRSPESLRIIRRLLRAIPIASNTQLQQMFNIFTGDAAAPSNPPPPLI